MAPVIHCVRHAQGYHNLKAENHSIHDPLLTLFGEQQCHELRKTFPAHDKISLIIASPLRRTIFTAYLGFGPSLANGHCDPSILALPEIQETSDLNCDTGTDPFNLRMQMSEKGVPVDLSLVKEGWNKKKLNNKWSPSSEALTKRAKEARIFIRDKVLEMQKEGAEDPEVVVVTHGGFLHYFTEDWEDSSTYNGTGWANTEYRSFNFADLYGPSTKTNGNDHANNIHPVDYENASFIETEQSRNRRGKVEPQHPREVQQELYRSVTQGWEEQASKLAEEDSDNEEEEIKGLVRVLTKDSEVADKKGGETPATDRRGDMAADVAKKERERRKSVSVTAVAA